MKRAAWLMILVFPLRVQAQGMLPARKAEVQGVPTPSYVMIGNTVPESLSVVDAAGNSRSLLSYKVASELLVVEFFSPRCEANQAQWTAYRRFYQTYKGWHAGFVGISVKSDETLDELKQAMVKAGLRYPVVRDDQGQVTRLLHATMTPEILIIDEFDTLRYRGDVKHAGAILEAVVGQEPLTTDPEPPLSEGCPIP